jgi:hypothetical protein
MEFYVVISSYVIKKNHLNHATWTFVNNEVLKLKTKSLEGLKFKIVKKLKIKVDIFRKTKKYLTQFYFIFLKNVNQCHENRESNKKISRFCNFA